MYLAPLPYLMKWNSVQMVAFSWFGLWIHSPYSGWSLLSSDCRCHAKQQRCLPTNTMQNSTTHTIVLPHNLFVPWSSWQKTRTILFFQMNKTPVVIKWLILLLFCSSNNQNNKHFLSLRQICTYFAIYAFSTFPVILLCSLLFSVACKAGLRKYRNTNIVHLMVVCLEANLHIHTTPFAVFITTQLYLSRTPIFILNLGLLRSTPIYNT